jgi:hypothetical protein
MKCHVKTFKNKSLNKIILTQINTYKANTNNKMKNQVTNKTIKTK